MLRIFSLNICRRLYHHDSSFQQKLPRVSRASGRVSRAITARRESEAQPKIIDRDPSKRLEPFPFLVTEDNKIELMSKKISPLLDMPYEEQLASKQTYCRNSLRYLAQQLYSVGTPVRLDVKRLPCQVNDIVKSTKLSKYRNKDEFSIWRGHDGQTPTVGYMLFPISKHGDTVCIEPNGCEALRDETIKLVDILQEFIRQQAKLPICYSLGLEGGWRRFIIRVNVEGELMLIGVASPRTLTVKQVIDERDNFKEFITRRSNEDGLKLKSLYFQPCPHSSCTHTLVPYELLYGQPTIVESINGYKFHISPESYLTNSTHGAEILFNSIKQTMVDYFKIEEYKQKPLIIDSRCGIGMNSIQLAKYATKVIGVDNSSQAIEDARMNAKLNEIGNVEFICSNLEIVLERILEKYSYHGKEIITICNTSKVGLHPNVIQALRKCGDINKILYITPKPDKSAVIDNLMTLCEKSQGKSPPPFIPTSATPVDVLPGSEESELIIALERLPN